MNNQASTVTVDREGIISDIQANLDPKRYGNKFSIIQEFIQNADDAKAKRLLIGYGRLTNARHTLLSEDGVFFVNDGVLTQDDRKHIFKVATSNKASDKDKIGHFGLGMKSAFHLCEAFFLFFNQPENREQLRDDADFLDPWYDDGDETATPQIRRAWHDEFNANGEEISNAVKAYLSPWVKDWQRWFCVWLPLRKQWMYDESCAPFVNVCLGVKEIRQLFSLDHSPVEIADMLPFLKTLKEVTLIDAENDGIIDRILVKSERRLSLESGNLDMRIEHSSKTLPAINVIGMEKLYKQEQFDEMLQDKDWPRSTKRNRNGEFLKEKVTPHTAVFWARTKGGNTSASKFSVKHCVFLPLTGERQKFSAPLELPFDLTLCLHATLFVDAGRQDFSTSSEKAASIKERWNHLLVSQGLLSMIITSMEREMATWEDESQITEAVKAFNCFLDAHDKIVPELNYRKHITKQYQFLNCLTNNGWKWQKIPASKRFLSIPLTRDSALQNALVQKVATQDLFLIQEETPGITASSSMTVDDVLFRRIRIAIDNLPPIYRYSSSFISWLERLMGKYQLDAQRQRELLVVFLDKISVQDYLKHQSEIYQLMKYFSDATQKIHLAKTNWDEDTFGLWKKAALLKGIQIIPMPFFYTEREFPELRNATLRPNDVSEHKSIPAGDLEILFQFIAGKMTKATDDDKRRALFKSIIFNYLRRCPEAVNNETILPLELFAFIDQDKEWVFLSMERIMDKSQTIFLSGGETTSMPKIAKAANIEYYRFQDTEAFYTDLMRTLFELVPFSMKEIGRFFQAGKLPKLNSVDSRVELFKLLLNSDDLSRYIDIARYLLLNDPERFQNRDDLFILPHENSIEPKAMEFWDLMLKMFFEKTGNRQTTLPLELVSCLTRETEVVLKIHSLDRDEILRHLKEVVLDKAMPFQVNRRTWQYLVGNFTHSDVVCCQVAMSLPVFPIQDNRFSPLDDMVFFNDGKCRIPDIALSLYNRCEIPPENLVDLYETTGTELPLWSYERTIKFCYEYHNDFSDEQLAPSIEEALKDVIKQEIDLDESILTFLRNQRFLVCSNGEYTSPSKILNLPNMPVNLKEVIHSSGLYLYEDIQMERFSKKAWNWFEEYLLPLMDEYPKILSSALAGNESFLLGLLPLDNDSRIYEITTLFNESTISREIFPAIGFVEELFSILSEKEKCHFAIQDFLAPLAGRISSERLINICNLLLVKENRRPSGLYLLYLEMLINGRDFSADILSQIKLPNARGEICRANELVHSGNGISISQVLHAKCSKLIPYEHPGNEKEIAALLPEFRNSHNLEFSYWEEKVEKARDEIDAYFDGWGDDFNYHIATLIILCDDSRSMQKYVKQRRWSNGDAENLRRKIQAPGLDFDFAKKYKGCRLFVDIYDGGVRQMPNLLGKPINVNLSKVDEMDSLLVGDKYYSCLYVDQPVAGKRTECKSVYLCLRRLSLEERQAIGQKGLMKLLENTIKILMEKMTGSDTAAEDIFEEIRKTELLDLEIIREVILDGLHSYLPSLGVKGSSLNAILDDWHDLKKQLIQAKQGKNIQDRVGELEEIILTKKKELREAVENDKQAQDDILQAVITRITEHCGYDFDSIPFELFQNADDAAAEMKISSSDLLSYRHFVIRLDSDSLSVLHFGRPINKSISNKFGDENEHGFQDDLEKMLQLWRSDKEIGEIRRTGKFGLGFKSVYQLTDAPLVASAHLRFSIRGTLFPMFADETEREILEKQINAMKKEIDLSAPLPQETLFYLPIRQGIKVQSYGEKKLEGAMVMHLDSFINSSDLLVIFSRAIKSLNIVDMKGRWKIDYKNYNTKCGIEIIHTRDDHDYGVIRLPKSGIDIALGYDSEKDKFKRLNDDIATIWITEPTKECYHLGFAVNGNFSVDIGRNSLMATNKHNEQLSKDAGDELYRFLKKQNELSPFSSHWLHSLWECFTGGDHSGQWRVRNTAGVGIHLPGIIWGTREHPYGYGKFIQEFPAVPTYLDRATNSFLKLRDCKFYCEEELIREENWRLFAPFSKNNFMATVSHRTFEALANILNIQLEEITGKMILVTWLQEHLVLSPELINGYPWEDIIDYCERRGYLKEVSSMILRCRFLSMKKTSVLARELISRDTTNNKEYETLLSFADEASILSDEYDEHAHCLFDLSNPHEQRFSIDCIADWALNANSRDAIKAVRDYLVIGKYSHELARKLMGKEYLNAEIDKAVKMRLGEMTIDSRKSNDVASEQNEDSSEGISSQLENLQKMGIITNEADAPAEGPEERKTELSNSDLNWLLDNWTNYRQKIVTKYNRDNYGIPCEELPPYPLKMEHDDVSARQRWMELFILAMSRRIGRQMDFQHSGFIKKCREHHWMEVFSSPDESIEIKSEKWIGILDSSFDKYREPETYSHWMQFFPWIYQCNKYLDKYVSLLKRMNQNSFIPQKIDDLFSPSSSDMWSHANIRVPPMKYALGHLGPHWIIRELIRSRTLTNVALHPFCFVPSKSVKCLFGSDDITSQKIYERLSGETFDLQFDIAFKALDHKDS